MTVHHAGRHALRAEADGFRPYYTRRLLISPAEGDLNKNILMTPHVELRGRVVDRHSRGIGGASVWLREETRGPFDKKSMVQSDQSGRFLMSKPPVSGTFFAEAAHPEYELASRVPVKLPKDEAVVITMHRVPDAQLGSIIRSRVGYGRSSHSRSVRRSPRSRAKQYTSPRSWKVVDRPDGKILLCQSASGQNSDIR